jgi:hypothetical protein
MKNQKILEKNKLAAYTKKLCSISCVPLQQNAYMFVAISYPHIQDQTTAKKLTQYSCS